MAVDYNEMHLLAKLALRTDQAVYNVRTGLCIVPDVNGDGELFGIQYGYTDLEKLIAEGEDGLPCSALEYTLQNYPAAGTGAADRLGARYESKGNVTDVYSDDLEQSDTLANMIGLMAENGAGWCLADPYSIAVEADIVPQRYSNVEYVLDNAEPEDKPLGWADFFEAAEGNTAYAMKLIDRAEWAYPSTMADEDLRCNEVAMIGGRLMLTNGMPVEEADILRTADEPSMEHSDKEMAMEAIRQGKDLYNVNTGLVLHPSVDSGTNNLADVTSAFVPLPLLIAANGHVANEPWKYAVENYIEPDGDTSGRIGWLPEIADVKAGNAHGIESQSSVYAHLLKMMEKHGDGWCFGDAKSIERKAESLVPSKGFGIEDALEFTESERSEGPEISRADHGNR